MECRSQDSTVGPRGNDSHIVDSRGSFVDQLAQQQDHRIVKGAKKGSRSSKLKILEKSALQKTPKLVINFLRVRLV
jgi:hypothetical protein